MTTKNPTFKPGDLVKHTTAFLQAMQMYTPPINGLVLGHDGPWAIVIWSDNDKRTQNMNEGNLELDQRGMAESTDEYRQILVRQFTREAAARAKKAAKKASKKSAKKNIDVAKEVARAKHLTGVLRRMLSYDPKEVSRWEKRDIQAKADKLAAEFQEIIQGLTAAGHREIAEELVGKSIGPSTRRNDDDEIPDLPYVADEEAERCKKRRKTWEARGRRGPPPCRPKKRNPATAKLHWTGDDWGTEWRIYFDTKDGEYFIVQSKNGRWVQPSEGIPASVARAFGRLVDERDSLMRGMPSMANPMMMTTAEAKREQAKARKFFEGLTTEQRWDIGDQLVLDEPMEWSDWGLKSRPSSAFMNELDRLRLLWEQEPGPKNNPRAHRAAACARGTAENPAKRKRRLMR